MILEYALISLGIITAYSDATDSRVENYIREYAWNAELVQGLDTAYEVVYPFQSRDRTRIGLSTRDYFYDVQTHFPDATFVIRSSRGRLKLVVDRVDSLFVDETTLKRVNAERVSEDVNLHPENCFYQGAIHNQPTSAVAISTCSGLRGVIFSANETYRIIPLKGGDLGRRHPHLLMKCEWTQRMLCANSPHTQWSHQSKPTSRGKRDSETAQKYIELALIADYAMAREYEFEFNPLVRHILEAVNIVDLIYKRELNTRVSLVYLEAWTGNNHMTIHSDITQTTLNLMDHLSSSSYAHNKDLTVFMTKHRFSRKQNLMAATGSVCTARAAAISTVGSVYEVEQTAISLAHSVGHLLGMEHDTELCKCDHPRGCLMQQVFGQKQKELTPAFSSCSVEDYLNTLRIGGGRCLFNQPFQESSLSQCGNKFVDPGEQCDCGSIQECDWIDPCCDPVTCRLRSHAQCAAGECCTNCKLKARGTECRGVRGSCDVPEHCDGVSGKCPVDASMINGSPCLHAKGICHQGMCATTDAQCVTLWGKGARGAEKQCYQRFNVLGIDHGNCGFDDVTDKPVPCDLHNAECGLLHCRAGNDIPLLSDFDGTHLKTEFFQGDKSFECKVVAGQRLGMVSDGSRCGREGICRGGACIPISDVAVAPTCPTNNVALICSGHGVCTTEDWCYCDSGFSGEDCGRLLPTEPSVFRATDKTYLGNASYIPRVIDNTRPSSENMDTYSMLIILGGVAGAIAMLLLFMLLCYRRRSSSSLSDKKLNGTLGKEIDGFSESSMDTAQRSIKFGNMPSYRDEKRWRRKQRHQLHKIHEVSDERDSVSNKSSAAASLASAAPTVIHPPTVIQHAKTVDDNFSFGPIRYGGPERGILKKGEGSTTPLLPRPSGLSVRSGKDELGYDSEPPCSLKIFEQSLKHLERCSPYHVPPIYDHDHNQRSPQSECWGGSGSRSKYKGHPGQFHPRRPMQMAVFSPQSTPRSITISSARGGYATDTEVGYTPQTPRRGRTWSHNSSQDQSPPSASQAHPFPSGKLSPANSVASSSSRGFLGRPAPLKLRNIEYLLKQLDTGNEDDSVSPCSSAELSVAEADKQEVEEGSNTESSRDALCNINCAPNGSGMISPDSSGCILESYESSAFLSFNNTPTLYQSHR